MPEEKAIETSAGIETPTETVNRITTARDAAIPVQTLENTEKPLDIPQVDPTRFGIGSTLMAGEQKAAELAATQAAEAEKTQSDLVKSLSEQLSGRGAERVTLEQEAGLPSAEKNLADLMSSIRLQTEHLAQFDDQTFLGEEAMRAEAAGRDITKGTFSAMARDRRLQHAIDRTGAAAGLRTQIASAELMQNNITAAQAQIKDALDLKYGPVEQQLELEMQFLNRAFQKADTAQAAAINARQNTVQQQLNDINDAKDMVTSAMAYATPEEVAAMNDPRLTPRDQMEKARSIVSRGLQQDRAHELRMRDLEYTISSQELANLIAENAGPETTNLAIDQMNTLRTSGSVRNVLSSVMGTLDIPATQRSNIGTVYDVAGSLEDFANGNLEGEFVGLGPVWGARGGGGIFDRMFKTEDFKERIANRSSIEAINLKVQQWASGAALTDEQTKQVEKITPRIGDSDEVVKQKTNQLYNFMLGVTETQLVTAGYNIQFPEVDLFELGVLIDQMSSKQRQIMDDQLLQANQTTTNAYGTFK